MDLRSYAKGRKNGGDRAREEVPRSAETENLEKQVEELSEKSESELMQQLMREVKKGREDGSFSEDALHSFTERVSPMLNEEQKRRLAALRAQLGK